MQLRVARLCLDCEELHVDNACPACASEHYAFLSNWLPSEERRRRRRPVQTPGESDRRVAAVTRLLGRWFRRQGVPAQGPMTRASDRVVRLDFEQDVRRPASPATLQPGIATAGDAGSRVRS
jgi:hypothetical protein